MENPPQEKRLRVNEARGARIRALVEELDLQQNEIARSMRVTPQAVTNWMAGKGITYFNLRRLAEHLNTTVDYLEQNIGTKQIVNRSSVKEVDTILWRDVPLVSLSELKPATAYNVGEKQRHGGPVVRVMRPASARTVAFSMTDNSMADVLFEGDIVIVDPELKYEPGDYIAAYIKDLDITVFRQFRYDGPDHCLLAAANPAARSYRYSLKDWKKSVEVLGAFAARYSQTLR